MQKEAMMAVDTPLERGAAMEHLSRNDPRERELGCLQHLSKLQIVAEQDGQSHQYYV